MTKTIECFPEGTASFHVVVTVNLDCSFVHFQRIGARRSKTIRRPKVVCAHVHTSLVRHSRWPFHSRGHGVRCSCYNCTRIERESPEQK